MENTENYGKLRRIMEKYGELWKNTENTENYGKYGKIQKNTENYVKYG